LVQNGINVSAEKNSGAGFARQHRVAAGREAAKLASAAGMKEEAQ
jgi:dihydropteroate synthase